VGGDQIRYPSSGVGVVKEREREREKMSSGAAKRRTKSGGGSSSGNLAAAKGQVSDAKETLWQKAKRRDLTWEKVGMQAYSRRSRRSDLIFSVVCQFESNRIVG